MKWFYSFRSLNYTYPFSIGPLILHRPHRRRWAWPNTPPAASGVLDHQPWRSGGWWAWPTTTVSPYKSQKLRELVTCEYVEANRAICGRGDSLIWVRHRFNSLNSPKSAYRRQWRGRLTWFHKIRFMLCYYVYLSTGFCCIMPTSQITHFNEQ